MRELEGRSSAVRTPCDPASARNLRMNEKKGALEGSAPLGNPRARRDGFSLARICGGRCAHRLAGDAETGAEHFAPRKTA